MPNYENGKIYKICSYNSDDVYYGSTCLKLCQRLAQHVCKCKYYKEGRTHTNNVTSFLILEQGNYYIELVETVPCSSKEELHIRERFWIKNHPCVNLYKNLVSTPEDKKEYNAAWAIANKETHRIQKKEWARKNAEYVRAHHNEYLLCGCGKYFTRGKRSSHNRTIFHKENINNVMFSQFLDL